MTGISVRAIAPDADIREMLAGAQFIDAYSIVVDTPRISARQAAEHMLEHSPWWMSSLMTVRDSIVSPFGIKASHEVADTRSIGFFPVIAETPDRLVVGFNDKHLDFRVVVDVSAAGVAQRITATTVVLTHNSFGRAYLALIGPFHKLIVRSMLRRVPRGS